MAAVPSRNRLRPALLLPLLLGGCAIADTGAFGRLQQEVVELQRQVGELKARPVAAPAPPPPSIDEKEVGAIRRSHADLAASVDQLSGELRSATTRFDEGRTETARTLSRLNDDAGRDRLALQDLQGKAQALEGRLKSLEERSAKAGGAPAPDVPGPGGKPPGKLDYPSFEDPVQQYEWGLGQLKNGKYRVARESFDFFLRDHKEHRLYPNALYWRGETYYGEKDYENAIVAFQDVVDRFPGHEKAADAMLKQGLSFLSLKDGKNGRLLLELVVSKHPKSSAAETAKRKLAELPPP